MDVFRKIEKRLNERNEIPIRLQYGMKESAILLGVSEGKLHDWISCGLIDSYKIQGKRFVSAKAMTEFTNRNQVECA